MNHSVPTLAGGTAFAGDITALSGLASVIILPFNHVGAAKIAVAATTNAASVVSNPPSKAAALSNASIQPALHRRPMPTPTP